MSNEMDFSRPAAFMPWFLGDIAYVTYISFLSLISLERPLYSRILLLFFSSFFVQESGLLVAPTHSASVTRTCVSAYAIHSAAVVKPYTHTSALKRITYIAES